MNKFKIISIFFLCCIIVQSAFSMDKFEENILHRACIYKYSDNQEEITETFSPGKYFTDEQFIEDLSRIQPIHINLIEMEVGDSILDQLIPYSHLIYGLSLEDNFFTNNSLSRLSKFSELRYLDLSNNSFTKPSLEGLANLKKLSILILTYNRIDPKELEAIREKMPHTQIVF